MTLIIVTVPFHTCTGITPIRLLMGANRCLKRANSDDLHNDNNWERHSRKKSSKKYWANISKRQTIIAEALVVAFSNWSVSESREAFKNHLMTVGLLPLNSQQERHIVRFLVDGFAWTMLSLWFNCTPATCCRWPPKDKDSKRTAPCLELKFKKAVFYPNESFITELVC